MSLANPRQPCAVCGMPFAPRRAGHRYCGVCYHGALAANGVAAALKNQQLARQARNAGY